MKPVLFLALVMALCCCLTTIGLFWGITQVLINVGNHGPVPGKEFGVSCWIPEGRDHCAPQFIIAGAMKCGTTSLWTYLLHHPQVLPLDHVEIDPKKLRTVMAEKEVRFWNDPAYSQLVKEYGFSEAFGYYLDLFQPISGTPGGPNFGKITGEASPMYISATGAAERIKNALPQAKIIIMLRNPVDRAYSDYWFRKSLKIKEMKDNRFDISGFTHDEIFEQCIDIELDMLEYCKLIELKDDPSMQRFKEFNSCNRELSKKIMAASEGSSDCNPSSPISHLCIPDSIRGNCQPKGLFYSLYFPQVYEWLQIFPKENLMFINSDYFYEETSAVMTDVTDFLILDDYRWDDVVKATFNIVNPNSVAGSKQEIVTEGNGKGLQIGASSSSSEYPPLDPFVRTTLNQRLLPYNKALANLVGDPSFKWEE